MDAYKILNDLKTIHDRYYKEWTQSEYEIDRYDDLILDLLNEIEDVFNPGRLNGN